MKGSLGGFEKLSGWLCWVRAWGWKWFTAWKSLEGSTLEGRNTNGAWVGWVKRFIGCAGCVKRAGGGLVVKLVVGLGVVGTGTASATVLKMPPKAWFRLCLLGSSSTAKVGTNCLVVGDTVVVGRVLILIC